MPFRSTLAIVTSICLQTLSAQYADATPITPPYGNINIPIWQVRNVADSTGYIDGKKVFDDYSTHNDGNAFLASQFGSVTAKTTLIPTVSASVIGEEDSVNSAESSLQYAFYIVPKSGDQSVIADIYPTIRALGSATGSFSGATSKIAFDIEPAGHSKFPGVDFANSVVLARAENYSNVNHGIIDVYEPYKLQTNTLYYVNMFARVTTSHGAGIGQAFLDPEISLTSIDAANYSILFSEGIENDTSPVPLPSSAPLFGAALVALGATCYGVRRKKAAATV